MQSIISSPPSLADLQTLWDSDPQSFYLSPMPGFEECLNWSAAQWSLATQPLDFVQDKLALKDASLWDWAVAQAPCSTLNKLVHLEVPVQAHTLCTLVQRLAKDEELKAPKWTAVFERAATHCEAWSTCTPAGVYAAPGIVASRLPHLLNVVKDSPGQYWKHPASNDTLLHIAVQSEWKMGLANILKWGVCDEANKQGVTARALAKDVGLAWAMFSDSKVKKIQQVKKPPAHAVSCAQMDLF